MSGLEYEIENRYHRNQPDGAIPLKFAEIVRVVKRPDGKRTYAEGCFWPESRCRRHFNPLDRSIIRLTPDIQQ